MFVKSLLLWNRLLIFEIVFIILFYKQYNCLSVHIIRLHYSIEPLTDSYKCWEGMWGVQYNVLLMSTILPLYSERALNDWLQHSNFTAQPTLYHSLNTIFHISSNDINYKSWIIIGCLLYWNVLEVQYSPCFFYSLPLN